MSLEQVVGKILVQQQEAADRQQQIIEHLVKNLPAATSTAQQQQHAQEVPLMEVVARSIEEFRYEPDDEQFFSQWYERYEEHFAQDAKNLDDASKVRVLLRKLSGRVYQRYADSILPKKPKELNFADTVARLKGLFDRQESLFSIRYKCFQITKTENEDFISYSARVNKQCEKFLYNQMNIDEFKCLMFVSGLQASSQANVRNKLLKLLDNKAESTTLDKLVNETQRMETLKTDSKLVEEAQEVTAVKTVSTDLRKQHKAEQPSSRSNHRIGKSEREVPRRPCWQCGAMHFVKNCDYAQHKCTICNKVGHKDGYCSCFGGQQPENFKAMHSNKKQNSSVRSKFRSNVVVAKINQKHQQLRKYIRVQIANKKVDLQYDTASDLTIISKQNWSRIGCPRLTPGNQKASDASNNNIPILGKFAANVQHNGLQLEATIFVSTVATLNIFGIDLITSFGYWDTPVSTLCRVTTTQQSTMFDTIKDRYPEVLQAGVGHCTKFKVKLLLKPNTTPVFRAKRPVPYASLAAVEAELDRLQNEGIITPVTHSDWAAPIVVVKKADGRIRICADYSTGVNNVMELNKYPIPTAEEIFAKLANCNFFTKIDLSDAYLQFEVDDEAKRVLAINTHRGLFTFNRLPPGVTSAPGAFQQAMDSILTGLDGVTAYLDDVIIATNSKAQNLELLLKVLDRFKSHGLRINWLKCELMKTSIKYLGHIIDGSGIHPDPSKTEAIQKMRRPTNVSELRSFLGAVNYYGKFIREMRKLCHPLDELLKAKTRWNWSTECERSFNEFKSILSSNLVLTNFNPSLPIVVAADASIVGIGAQIFHQLPDGTQKVICHASRALNETEKRYSQIEKEALALVYACKKFHRMIYGRTFTLMTDHKPLLTIFGTTKGIPTHTANRIQRWALALMAYNFKIQYIKTNDFGNVDVLSRLIEQHRQTEEDYVIAQINVEEDMQRILQTQVNDLPITHRMIQQATKADPVLRQVVTIMQQGWPFTLQRLAADIKPFFYRRETLSTVDGCLLSGERIIIPQKYQSRIIKQLHRGHPGIGKMKALARSYVYWPKLDADITECVRQCQDYASAAKSPRKSELSPWPTPHFPLQRVHMDIFGPVRGKYYLIMVDAYSKWPEVCQLNSISASEITMYFNEFISRYGQPQTVVSENGTQFTSEKFKDLCNKKGIQHLRSAPYHPQSNGQAERFVDTVKRALEKAHTENEPDDKENLCTFLSQYRATPNENVPEGKSPAECFIGRKLRTPLDLLKQQHQPISGGDRNVTMKQQFDKKHGGINRSFYPGQPVYVRAYKNNALFWEEAEIIEKVGTVMYNVLLRKRRGNMLIRAHTNQLRHRYPASNPDEASQEHLSSTGQSMTPQLRRSVRARRMPTRLQD